MNMLNTIKSVIDKYNEDLNGQVNLASAAARVDLAERIAEKLQSLPEIPTITFSDDTTTHNTQQLEFFENKDDVEHK